MPVETLRKVRFGPFELDARTGELRKEGYRVNLHGQPVEVLTILLEQPGELVTREELCKRLWPQDTFVDFEHSLNTAIKKLRQALDDDVETPRYIETLPKKGYRFVGAVEPVAGVASGEVAKTTGESPTAPPSAPSLLVPPAIPLPTETPKSRRWVRGVVALAVLAVAAGIGYELLRPRVPVVTAIHQLTHGGQIRGVVYGIQQVATDGNRVYFNEWTSDPAVQPHLAEMSVKGGESSRVSLPPIRFPLLVGSSTEGTELLVIDFFDQSGDLSNGSVWQATMPSGPLRKISGVRGDFAALVPNRNQVVYDHGDQLRRLFIADREGGTSRTLLTTPHDVYLFAVSPDGNRIRFEMSEHLWETNLQGKGMTRLFPEMKQSMCCGSWSPDGKWYGFAVQEQGVYNLWLERESGRLGRTQTSKPVQLTNGPVSFATPALSPDGRRLFALGTVPRAELEVYDAASRQYKPFLNGVSAGYVDFSRDGGWVAYVALPQGTLWRSRIDGSERLQLTFPPMRQVINPEWSPDGRLIAFTEWSIDEKKVYIVPTDGGDPMLLLSGDFNPSDPTWSPDGKSIAYSGVSIQDGTGTEIRILDLESRKSRSIANSEHIFSARLSPDGLYVVAQSDDLNKLFLYTFATDHWVELPNPEDAGVGWPHWSPDSRYVYAVISNARVYRWRVSGGKPEMVLDVTNITGPGFPAGERFALAPDDRILVIQDRSSTELYGLDVEYR